MAWLALALERAGRLAGVERPNALDKLAEQFLNVVGARGRRRHPVAQAGSVLQRTRPTGPAAIFLARHDRLRRAQQMADWIDETLIDPETHLVFDGIKGGSLVRAQYTYCQGVVLGLETELAVRTEDPDHAKRVHRLVAAVASNMAPDGRHHGARAVVTAACSTASWRAIWRWSPPLYRGTTPRTSRPERPPASWCSTSARAAWDNRQTAEDLPLFAAFWDRNAEIAALPQVKRPSSSRARSTPRRFPSVICRCSCRAGC